MTEGAGFRICGTVSRKNVREKVAFLTLTVAGFNGKPKYIDTRTFDAALMADVDALVDGSMVEVTGQIDIESVKGADREPIMIGGKAKWVPALTLKAIKVDDPVKMSKMLPKAKGSNDLPF